MTLLALSKTQEAGGQIALAVVLGIAGLFLLLPRPRGRFIAGGIAALVASAAVFGAWVYRTFGNPLPDVIGSVLFWLFAAGALVFGTVLVAQKNPARGAIAFAFVVLSTCGLFLLLAAPFLMAATIIIYAGAIIVTFLFVLMLSHADGPSDENDRSREPLYGSFAGFAFVGLVLFTLYQTSQASAPAEPGAYKPDSRLPAPVITADERKTLADVVARLNDTDEQLAGDLRTGERLEPSGSNTLKQSRTTSRGRRPSGGRSSERYALGTARKRSGARRQTGFTLPRRPASPPSTRTGQESTRRKLYLHRPR